MTNEDLLREFLQDDIFEKKYLFSKEKINSFIEYKGPKIIEAIKLAIDKVQDGEPEEEVSRQLNSFLNK